jgi:hypothetical protein
MKLLIGRLLSLLERMGESYMARNDAEIEKLRAEASYHYLQRKYTATSIASQFYNYEGKETYITKALGVEAGKMMLNQATAVIMEPSKGL